jgi:oligopeptide transport system ATP-binding protein
MLESVAMSVLLETRDLSKSFRARDGKGEVKAVSDVNLILNEGETLGIVGESGCGKSTLARMLVNLIAPSHGAVLFQGENLQTLSKAAMRARRRDIQIVFQDPYASLDPRMSIAQIIAEPLQIHGIGTRAGRAARVKELLSLVGLDAAAAGRYPHEFSGGQRQRIGIARAIALEPKLLILDEPVSALDVSIQSQILNLLDDIKARLKLSYIFISHDLAVVEHVSDRVAVMYLGRVVEEGRAEDVLRSPLHPYTQALISSVPELDVNRRKTRILLQGDPPNPESIPDGCAFHPRCPFYFAPCSVVRPGLVDRGSAKAACHLLSDTNQPAARAG